MSPSKTIKVRWILFRVQDFDMFTFVVWVNHRLNSTLEPSSSPRISDYDSSRSSCSPTPTGWTDPRGTSGPATDEPSNDVRTGDPAADVCRRESPEVGSSGD